MADAKAKKLRSRLEEIKSSAASAAANPKADAKTAANLAEEAAGLGLELADHYEGKGN